MTATCTCGRTHTAEEWRALEYVGRMEDGQGGWLELRNCQCGSTISTPIDDVDAPVNPG